MWVLLACWRVMVIPHGRRVRVVIWRHRVVAGETMRARWWRQLHEGGFAGCWRLEVLGLEVEVHLVALNVKQLNYKSSALADVTKLTIHWWEPRYEIVTSTWVALCQTTKLMSHAWSVNLYVCEKRSRARIAYANLIGRYDNMALITLYFIF